ncbi:MAG: ABC transporter permease, partial [Promethearchaeota archaeon]
GFKNRGFEIMVEASENIADPMKGLQQYLETEPLVETKCIVHRSLFLYNLNNKDPSFNVIKPPANESDFHISDLSLSDGAFIVPDEFMKLITPLLEFEKGSNVSFSRNNTGIIISRHLLTLIETKTNQTYQIGSKISFSIARSFFPPGSENLGSLNPFKLENLTINAIFNRISSHHPLSPSYYHETLGDGIFISNKLITKTVITQLELNGFYPYLFIRTDRNKLKQLGSEAFIEIEHLASRIYQQGYSKVGTQTQEIQSFLFYFEQARVSLLLTLLPLLLLAEIFYLRIVPLLLKNREIEFQYLRLRGATDREIFIINGVEFSILVLIGSIFGIIVGSLLLGVLMSTPQFLELDFSFFGNGLLLLSESNSVLLIVVIISIASINSIYGFLRLFGVIRSSDRLEDANSTLRTQTNVSFTKSLLMLTFSFGTFVFFILMIPLFLTTLELSRVSIQLIPLITIILMIIWILFSFQVPQLCLQIFQSSVESLHFFSTPQRKLKWLNLFRRRDQFHNLLLLLTLSISLFSLSIIFSNTIQNYNDQNAAYSNGGDLKVHTDPVKVEEFRSLISSIKGINACLGLLQQEVRIGDYDVTLIGIDPSEYYTIAKMHLPSVIEGPAANRLWYSLNDDPLHSIIMNDYLANVFKWNVGSTVSLKELSLSLFDEWNATITAIISSAPGIGSLKGEISQTGVTNFGGYVIAHKDLFTAFGIEDANIFLLRLDNPNQQSSTSIQLRKLSFHVRTISTAASVRQYRQSIMQMLGVQGILTVNAFGTLFITLIGISIYNQYLIRARSSEFAIFQALGATRQNISRMVIIEIIFIIALGLALGLITGIYLTLGFLTITRSVKMNPFDVFSLELTLIPEVLVLSMFLIMLIISIAALVPLKKIHQLEITQILRNL